MSRFLNRLVVGGLIDRSKALKFWFNGKAYSGYAGDTLASALIANGVTDIARSVRHNRPRGIVGCGREEPNAFVLVGDPQSGERFDCATTLNLFDGLRARSVTRPAPSISWPEKTTKRNNSPMRATDFGKPVRALSDLPAELHIEHCDVLIIGGGSAGLATARTAASTGAKVIVAERDAIFGGQLLWDDLTIDELPAQRWISTIVGDLAARPNVTLLRSATVTSIFEQNLVHVVQRLEETPGASNLAARLGGFRQWKIRPRHIVVATGATEQIIALPNNDRPGVMLASAVRQYLRRFAVLPGRQAVIVTNNDSAYMTAFDLAQIGVKVMAVVDNRESPQSALPLAVRAMGIDVIPGSVVTGLDGKNHVSSVTIATVDERGQPRPRGVKTFDCDLVCMSGGWNPDLDLFNESGGDVRYEEPLAGFVPGDHAGPVTIAGAAAGHDITRDCIQSGYEAGQYAGESLKCGIAEMPRQPITGEKSPTPPRALGRPPASPDQNPADQWIGLSADVTLDDLDVAVRDNHRNLEHVAARTGLFRGPDAGLQQRLERARDPRQYDRARPGRSRRTRGVEYPSRSASGLCASRPPSPVPHTAQSPEPYRRQCLLRNLRRLDIARLLRPRRRATRRGGTARGRRDAKRGYAVRSLR